MRPKPVKHPEPTIEWLRVGDLKFDERVNPRQLNKAKVASIASDLDIDALGLISVWHTDNDEYVVIDGQHRTNGLLEMGWADQKVPCKVWRGITLAQAADMFLKLNDTLNMKPMAKFLARLSAQDGIALTISEICNKNGVVIDGRAGDGHLQAVSAVEKVYHGDRRLTKGTNPQALRDTLSVITAAWGTATMALNGDILLGVGTVFHRYGKQVDKERLTAVLSRMTGGPSGLLNRGRSWKEIHGGTVAQAIASVLVDQYNRGKRTMKLPVNDR